MPYSAGLMHNRTTPVIAHRLATVKKVDRIVVMNQGRVQAVGTRGQLIETNPLYARLAELQFGVRTAGSSHHDMIGVRLK